MAYLYEKFVTAISAAAHGRSRDDLQRLEPWCRKKYAVLNSLKPETVFDVIQNCDFKTVRKNDVIILQGEEGEAFYIILQGSVSILLKDSVEFTEEQKVSREIRREELGARITTLGEGKTFGDLALIEGDHIRTASVVADEVTDLAVIHRDLYKRSVAQVIQKDYQERLDFVNQLPLCRTWSEKWKKHLAASLIKGCYGYEDVLVKQGDPADRMHFIISGEVKLQTEPQLHEGQFGEFMRNCECLLSETEKANAVTPNYTSLSKWLSLKTSRIRRLNSAPVSHANEYSACDETRDFKRKLSPSAARRQATSAKAQSSKYNICYLESGQMVGDVEFLTGLKRHYATAVCTQHTVVMTLHRAFYDRWFRKKNPFTVKQMRLHLEPQLLERFSKGGLAKKVPLLRSITMKVEELNGHRLATGLRMRRLRKQIGLDMPAHSNTTGTFSNPFTSVGKQDSNFQLEWNLLSARGQYKAMHAHASLSAMPLPRPVLSEHPVDSPEDATNDDQSKEETGKPPQDKRKQKAIILYHMGTARTVTSRDTQGTHPGDGIFVKLMHVSHPELDRSHLNLTSEEYDYLVDLRKRLGRTLDDLHPKAQVQKLYNRSSASSSLKNDFAGFPKLNHIGISSTRNVARDALYRAGKL